MNLEHFVHFQIISLSRFTSTFHVLLLIHVYVSDKSYLFVIYGIDLADDEFPAAGDVEEVGYVVARSYD